MAKLIKICNVRDEKTNTRPLEPETSKEARKPLEEFIDEDLQVVNDFNSCEKKFISSSQVALILFSHKALFGVMKALCQSFQQVEILEHYGEYMKLRVPKQDRTVGSVFRTMEKNKEDYDI